MVGDPRKMQGAGQAADALLDRTEPVGIYKELQDLEQDLALLSESNDYYGAAPAPNVGDRNVAPQSKDARCLVVLSSTYEEMAKDAENVRQAILNSIELTPDLRLEVDWRLKTLRGKYTDLAARDVSAVLEAKSAQTAFDIAGDLVNQHVAVIGRELAKTGSTSKVLSEEDPVFSRMIADNGTSDVVRSIKESKDVVVSFLKARKDSGLTKTNGLKNILASYSELFSCGTVPWCSVHPQKIRETLRNSAARYFLEATGDDRDSTDVTPSDFIDQTLEDRINLLSIVLGVWFNDRVDEFGKSYLRATKNDPNYVKGRPSYDTEGSEELFRTVTKDLIYWRPAYDYFESANQ